MNAKRRTRYLYKLANLHLKMDGEKVHGQEVWIGVELDYDLDLSASGIMRVKDMTAEELESVGVTRFQYLDGLPDPDRAP